MLAPHSAVPEAPLPVGHSETYAANRAETLKGLLGVDYDYAHESGLIDMFYYNPETGEDALLHTLAGEVLHGKNGEKIAHGFHHEPSGANVWAAQDILLDDAMPRTRVDRTHLEKLSASKRKEYKEVPYEPYKAKVFVDNLKKLGGGKSSGNDTPKVVEAKNGMYPKEYDALTVLQTIRQAYLNRKEAVASTDHEGRRVMVSESYAPMLDGESLLKIRLVLDLESEKIRTAIPLVNKPGIMRLSRAAIKEHLGL